MLGRETSYDTGSDAGVRVRANDVRKRLASYYAANPNDTEFTLEIPAGSYVPRFYVPRVSKNGEFNVEPAVAAEPLKAVTESPRAPELSLHQLALPTLVALFLCVVCIRWQLAREHPFLTFWNSALQDHHALLYVPPSAPGAQQDLVSANRFENAAPLLDLAGQFHSAIALTRSLDSSGGTNSLLILIGTVPASSPGVLNNRRTVEDDFPRLVIQSSLTGRHIVDRSEPGSEVNPYGRAGLLTITNGAQPSIEIGGTDDGAIDALVHILCQPDTFPSEPH